MRVDTNKRYGEEVERYLDVYLRTQGASGEGAARALVARGKARREAGQRLLTHAERGESLFLDLTADCGNAFDANFYCLPFLVVVSLILASSQISKLRLRWILRIERYRHICEVITS